MASEESLNEQDLSPVRPVANAFCIGRPGETEEYIFRGARFLVWPPNGHEDRLSGLAGWQGLPHGVQEDGMGYIVVPEGTRNASGILGGLEAWEGEKEEVVRFVVNYSKASYAQTGSIDTAATFDTVAVTKDRRMFVTPPHHPENDPGQVNVWSQKLAADLSQILPHTEHNLIDLFREGTSGIL